MKNLREKVMKMLSTLSKALKSRFEIYKKNLKEKKKSTLITTILLALVVIIGSFFIIKKNNQDKFQDAPMLVNTEMVKRDTINMKKTFNGKVRSSESVTLTSEVVGKVVAMKKDGAFVKKGEIILELDSTEANGKYMIALGKKNEEDLKLKTTLNLFKEGYRTQNHLDEQRAKYQTAQGHLMEAEAYLNKHKIKAPFDGVIGLQTQSIGATINQHTKLITITNLSNLQIEFLVSENELRNLGGIEQIKNAEIFVTLDGQLLPIEAEFSAYETVIETETNAIAVRAKLRTTSSGQATPGQLGHVTVRIGNKENVLTTSESAVETTHGVHYVYKVVQNLALQTPVKVGVKDGNKVEILAGLQEGDIVITSGHHRIHDGMTVKSEDEYEKKTEEEQAAQDSGQTKSEEENV